MNWEFEDKYKWHYGCPECDRAKAEAEVKSTYSILISEMNSDGEVVYATTMGPYNSWSKTALYYSRLDNKSSVVIVNSNGERVNPETGCTL